ncbi:MAG: hypothetical protein Q7U41_00355, partial [Microbacterium sp.]|nr:hypothetical protein [Microbacterium sp.]
MLIFYTDETGDSSLLADGIDPPTLRPGTSNFFSLSGVGIRDSSRRPLAESLIKLKRKHFGAAVEGPWGDTEIKGKFVTQATPAMRRRIRGTLPRGWESIDSAEKVDALSRDIGLLLDKFRPLVFVIAIDKREMLRVNKTANPVGVAYTYLHQRIALTMEDLHSGEAA